MQGESEGVRPHPALTAYYESDADKAAYLRGMFNASARHYDRVLHYGFFGLGSRYRRRALQRAGLRPGMRALDVACGTGGVLQQASGITGRSDLVGLDPSEGMLEVARSKFPEATFWRAEAESIPCGDAQFDFLMMGYGLRHVRTFDEAFREYFRVLKPGGRVLVMEISRPRSVVGYHLAKFYLKQLVPTLAFVICRDEQAREMMRYFCDSINACASREAILAALERAGFADCQNHSELGLFSAFTGRKPGA